MRGPNLTDNERHRIVCTLFEYSTKGKPKHGQIKELAQKFQVSRKTITEWWTKAKTQTTQGIPLDVNSRMPGKKGRSKITCPVEFIKTIALQDRATIDGLAFQVKHSRSTVYRWIRKGLLKSHTSAISPELTADNKFLRIHFVLGKLYLDTLLRKLKFKDMSPCVHVDEKWFYMTKATQRYYLVNDEEIPYRSCKSKRFIVKIMFLAAVARPTYKENGDVLFDGKIGIFPFTFEEPAKRNSKNRAVGTMVTKAVESVNRDVMKEYFINKLIPALKTKWPQSASKNIIIQQDNAKPHVKSNDPDFVAVATSDGFNIQLQQQPPNSPDLNVLDLGFFRSIQSLQSSKPCKTVDELVKNVENAYENLSVECLDNVWLSLQACMIETMKMKGHNDYPLPHLKKAAQRRAGTLPRDLIVDDDLVVECITYLHRMAGSYDLNVILENLGADTRF
ncbi:hypothetical protein RND81_10G171000 [Saponaria officinalis]|uniref:DUF7769 domain-containing protein n=1 Tax=Saponaria officinalis TaxID=3572 RepID=A0AAW1I5L0_SAPOF